MRQLDALHAIREARKLKWVDPDNIFLVTDSDGHWLEELSRSDRNGLQKSLQALARRRFEPSKRQRLIEQLELAQQAFAQWQMKQFSESG